MIIVTDQKVKFEGRKIEILHDLSRIIYTLVESDSYDVDDIKLAIDFGFKSPEEIEKMNEELREDVHKAMKNFLENTPEPLLTILTQGIKERFNEVMKDMDCSECKDKDCPINRTISDLLNDRISVIEALDKLNYADNSTIPCNATKKGNAKTNDKSLDNFNNIFKDLF